MENQVIEQVLNTGESLLQAMSSKSENTKEVASLKESLAKQVILAVIKSDDKTLKTLDKLFTKDNVLYEARKVKTMADCVAGNLIRKGEVSFPVGKGKTAKTIRLNKLSLEQSGEFPEGFVTSTAYAKLNTKAEEKETVTEKAILEKIVSDNPSLTRGLSKVTKEVMSEELGVTAFNILWFEAEAALNASITQQEAETKAQTVLTLFSEIYQLSTQEATNLLSQLNSFYIEKEEQAA